MLEGLGTRWFALYVRARQEKFTARGLEGKGFEVLLPLYACLRRWSDRTKRVELPLFPRYLFCRLDPRDRLPVLMTPGAVSLVGTGNIPVPVADVEIAALQAIVKSGLPAQPCPFIRLGQFVRIEDGPFSGLTGILISVKNQHRLVVSISLLRRSVAVEIDRLYVAPISGPIPLLKLESRRLRPSWLDQAA